MRPVLILATILALCAPILARKSTPTPPPEEAGRVIAYTSWSPTTFYIAFRVEDPMVVGNQTLPLSQPWLDDAVALYLNLNPGDGGDEINKDCLRVVISAAGGATVQRGSNGEWRDDPSWFKLSPRGTIRYGTRVLGTINNSTGKDQGYEVEIGLSWELMGVLAPFRPRSSDPLPAIGMALACYSQGETTSVSCWPHTLSEEDLNHPAKWGTLQFSQNIQPVASKEPLATASITAGEPEIDGAVKSGDWLTAGVQIFPKRLGETVTIEPGRQNVSLFATWYLLNPLRKDSAHQPMEPGGPWVGAESPLYHLQQLRDIKRAGLDTLAVVLPVDESDREAMRRRLSALVYALKDYSRATDHLYQLTSPTLLPVIDLSTATLDLRTEEGQAALAGWIDEFYRQVPAQFRLMVTNPAKTLCYPILVTAPSQTMNGNAADLERVNARLQASWGAPVGWLLDRAWKSDAASPAVLSYCNWSAVGGMQLGEGSLLTAVVTPGSATSRKDNLSRREGEVYDNGWLKIAGASPDLVLVRSWNDFQHGTEIAPSRQYGYQFVDSTRLATFRLSNRRGFGIRILRHTLPAVLRPGQTYPVEMVLKNGSVEKMLTSEGFRVDYRIFRDGQKVTNGTATSAIMLTELSTARIQFPLATWVDRHTPFPNGDYQLLLDFHRNKVPYLSLPLLTKTLGTLVIPFTVGVSNDVAQVVQADTPGHLPAGAVAPIDVQVRNLSAGPWQKGKAAFRLRWTNAAGEAQAETRTLPVPQTVESGNLLNLQGNLPPAPAQPGWYQLQIELQQHGNAPPVMVDSAVVRVDETDLRAQFLSIDLPNTITAETKEVEVPIALCNPGLTAWPAKETCLRYQWLGWDGQPVVGATGTLPLTDEVKAGGATTQRMMVTPPPGGGVFHCAFALEARGQAAVLQANPLTMPLPVTDVSVRPAKFYAVDLKAAFNDWVASTDTVVTRADVDGSGNAFPLEEFLPDATNPPLGYKAGYYLAKFDPAAAGFLFGQTQAGKAPMVRAIGQQIALPECAATALHLVAFNTGYTNPVTLTVQYADGSEQSAPLNISNWLDQPSNNEPVILTSRYIRTPKGDDWYLQGSLFTYRIALDPAKKVKAVTLPKLPQTCIVAVTLEMPER